MSVSKSRPPTLSSPHYRGITATPSHPPNLAAIPIPYPTSTGLTRGNHQAPRFSTQGGWKLVHLQSGFMGGRGKRYASTPTLNSHLSSRNSSLKNICLLHWLQFPVGMGTSAVYLSLSGWSEKFRPRDYIEYIFFWLTLVLFVLNTTTLLLQAIREFFPSTSILNLCRNTERMNDGVYPSRAKALLTDPHKGVFFPLLVSPYDVSNAMKIKASDHHR